MIKEKKFLVFLFLISLLVRASVFNFYLSKDGNYWQIDSSLYHNLATSISKGLGLVTKEGKPNFYRLPGYSIFLSPFYKIFGAEYETGQAPQGKGVMIALWAQVFFASFIPVLIFFLSLQLIPNLLLAKVASMWSTFHLGFVLYSGYFMTESLFILFFLLFAIIFLQYTHLFYCPAPSIKSKKTVIEVEPSNKFMELYMRGFCLEPACTGPSFIDFLARNSDVKISKKKRVLRNGFPPTALFFAGAMLGFAGIIRPVGHYLMILSLIMVTFSNEIFWTKFKRGLALLGGFFFPVAPWLIRNYALLGHLFFHTLPGGHFLYLSASRVAMHTQNCTYWEARGNLKAETKALIRKEKSRIGRSLNEIEKCNVAETVAIKYFKSNPRLAIQNWLVDILRTSLSLYSAELIFIESGRKVIDSFKKDRSVMSMFTRYLFPETEQSWLKGVVFAEIITFLIVIIGFIAGLISMLIQFIMKRDDKDTKVALCTWTRSLTFMALFLVISLAGGYARMRLPIEPFLIILSASFWVPFIKMKMKWG